MRVYYYDNGRYVEIPFERLISVRVVDGSGTANADQVSVEYHALNEPKPLPQLIVEQALEEGPILHGPYDLQTLGYSPSTHTATLTGTKNLHWQDRLSSAGTTQERTIRGQLSAVLSAMLRGAVDPYAHWLNISTGIGLEGVVGQLTGELARVRNFASFIQVLERVGLTAFTYNTFDARGVASIPIVSIIPKYPTSVGGSQYDVRGANTRHALNRDVFLVGAELEDFKTEVPDLTNPSGRWKTRTIVSGQRLFAYADDVLYYVSGNDEISPVVYSDTVVGEGWTQVDHDLKRWDMQNTSRSCVLKQAYDMMYETPVSQFVVPHQRVTARGETWLVNAVEHTWDASLAYIRTLNATEWQGSFERVVAREIS